MYHLLLIVALCCFAPGMSSVIRDGKDEQSSDKDASCLQKAMKNNEKAADSVANLICMYINSKGLPDEGLIKAIQNLEEVTGCNNEEIFGTQDPEQVAMDESGVLSKQINIMQHLLEKHNAFYHNVAVLCALQIVIKNKEGTGQGHKRVARGLLGGLLGGILGGQGSGGQGSPGLLGGLTGSLGLGTLLGGSPGGQSSGGLLGGLLDGQRGLLGSVLGGVGGILGGQKNSGCGQASQGLGGQGVLDLPTSLLGVLLGGGGGGGGPLGGLTNILG